MENTSFIALSRQSVLRRQMDIVANNIANMNTTGFKAERMMFQEHLVRSKGGDSYFGEKQAYVRDVASMRDLKAGPIEQTSNPLDVALSGDGYFVIQTDLGDRYTRNGRFQLDSEGQLVNQNGQPVLTDGGAPVFFAPDDTEIAISRDGTISTENGILGRLAIARFENQQALEQGAGGLYATDQQPLPNDGEDGPPISVVQFALEGSNVEGILEMTRMIEVHRAYDSVKNFIDKEDERQKQMIRELVRVA
jgi:flagellar basal-body rod protein FlgF